MSPTSKRRPTRSGVAKGNLYAWVQATWRRPLATLAVAGSVLLAGCGDKPVVVNTVSDTFCQRVERFHATEAERAALKANSGPLERLIRWVAGINGQWDAECLKPAKGA